MAGTIELSKSLCWTPPGWIYDNALTGMADHVGPPLRNRLLECLTDVNGGYLDLKGLARDDVELVLAALRRFTLQVETAGPASLYDPSFYEGYVRQLKGLEDLVKVRLADASDSSW